MPSFLLLNCASLHSVVHKNLGKLQLNYCCMDLHLMCRYFSTKKYCWEWCVFPVLNCALFGTVSNCINKYFCLTVLLRMLIGAWDAVLVVKTVAVVAQRKETEVASIAYKFLKPWLVFLYEMHLLMRCFFCPCYRKVCNNCSWDLFDLCCYV